MTRLDVTRRIAVGNQHLDVAVDYPPGPVPCITARERYADDTLVPLTVAMLNNLAAHHDEEPG